MGMNYYWYREPVCEYCGRDDKPLHIGKSSWGWCFSLHIIPDEGINTLDDWREKWQQEGTYILDEAGTPITVKKMEQCITERKQGQWTRYAPLRHELDYRHCVGHGEGTWDYITGEFC